MNWSFHPTLIYIIITCTTALISALIFYLLYRTKIYFYNLEIFRLSADITNIMGISIASLLFFILGYVSFVKIIIKSYFLDNSFKQNVSIFKTKCNSHLFLLIYLWSCIIIIKFFSLYIDTELKLEELFELFTGGIVFTIAQDTLGNFTFSMPIQEGGIGNGYGWKGNRSNCITLLNFVTILIYNMYIKKIIYIKIIFVY